MEGNELKQFRKDNKITLSEFSRLSGVSTSALSRFEVYNATITTETAEAINNGITRFYVEKINELEDKAILNLDDNTLRYLFEFHKSMFGYLGIKLIFEQKSFYITADNYKYKLNINALIDLFYKTNDFYLENLASLIDAQIKLLEKEDY